MDLVEPCNHCSRAQAKHLCPKCQRRVCDSCFDHEKGVCLQCSGTPLKKVSPQDVKK